MKNNILRLKKIDSNMKKEKCESRFKPEFIPCKLEGNITKINKKWQI